MIPLLTGALLFAGCEATVVDAGPSHRSYAYGESRPYYRSGYSSSGYRRGYDNDYDRDYDRSYSGRSRTSYRSDVDYRNTTVNRTNINRTNVNRTVVNRNVNQTNVNRKVVNVKQQPAKKGGKKNQKKVTIES